MKAWSYLQSYITRVNYRFGLRMDGKCMAVSPNHLSPIRKLFGSKDPNDCKISMKYALNMFLWWEFLPGRFYYHIKGLVELKYLYVHVQKPLNVLKIRSILIVVLSFTYQTDNSESNCGINYIEYRGVTHQSDTFGF